MKLIIEKSVLDINAFTHLTIYIVICLHAVFYAIKTNHYALLLVNPY